MFNIYIYYVTEDDSDKNEQSVKKPDSRVVNLDNITVHPILQYCCSKNTNRIYLYDQVGVLHHW